MTQEILRIIMYAGAGIYILVALAAVGMFIRSCINERNQKIL